MTVLIVDGGGTKTRAWLVRTGTRIPMSIVEAGPSNFGAVGAAGVAAVLQELLAKLPGQTQPGRRWCWGWRAWAARRSARRPKRRRGWCFLRPKRYVITDAELAYRGAFAGGKPGILLITGTGTIGLYRTPISHEFTRAGGWGPLLGDKGGGAWLGREALRHCLLEWERDELSPAACGGAGAA